MLYMNGIIDSTRVITYDIAAFGNGDKPAPPAEAADLVRAEPTSATQLVGVVTTYQPGAGSSAV